MNDPLIQFMIDDLAKSGISHDWAVKQGWRPITAKELPSILGFYPKDINGSPCEGYLIPFFDPITNNPMLCPDGQDYVRIKLRVPAKNKTGKPAKYLSKRKAGQHAFISKDVHQLLTSIESLPVVFTEGEKKAVKATLEGMPVIGLTGNWGWNIPKTNELLPELQLYLSHKVWIAIYDNDAKNNPDFHDSLRRQCQSLSRFGATLYVYYIQ